MYVIEIKNAYSFCYSNVVAGLFIQTNVDNSCHQIKKMLNPGKDINFPSSNLEKKIQSATIFVNFLVLKNANFAIILTFVLS